MTTPHATVLALVAPIALLVLGAIAGLTVLRWVRK